MSDAIFPFAALVGLDTLKLALQLSAIDSRLSVLIRVIIDTEDIRGATGRPRQLADVMGATYTRLDALDSSQVITIVRGSR